MKKTSTFCNEINNSSYKNNIFKPKSRHKPRKSSIKMLLSYSQSLRCINTKTIGNILIVNN